MISVRDLIKTFGGIRAVDGCSLDVAEGTITGLIGPNGAGKTTLFNIIAGFMRPDFGRIELAGRDITRMAPHRLFRLGLVRTFQIPHAFSRMTVLESLMVVPGEQSGESILSAWLRWGKVQREERELRHKAEEVIDFLQLSEVKNELAGNLSGGQKKLLELGRAMMSDARVILLDEPGAGVNPTLLAKLTDNILQLNEEFGYTFCVIEHDMDLIAKLCDPIIVMVQGQVLATGSMDEIRRNDEVVEAYLGGGVVEIQTEAPRGRAH
ncbi:MAG: ABC transporter ATP-binding protein [Alphaproteobacteria bacterium]